MIKVKFNKSNSKWNFNRNISVTIWEGVDTWNLIRYALLKGVIIITELNNSICLL